MKLSRVFKVLMIVLVVLCFSENVYCQEWLKYQEKTDINNNGTIDEASYYTYDIISDKLTQIYSFTDGGSTRQIAYFKYDENGNHLRTEVDYGYDGTIDTIIYSYYREK